MDTSNIKAIKNNVGIGKVLNNNNVIWDNYKTINISNLTFEELDDGFGAFLTYNSKFHITPKEIIIEANSDVFDKYFVNLESSYFYCRINYKIGVTNNGWNIKTNKSFTNSFFKSETFHLGMKTIIKIQALKYPITNIGDFQFKLEDTDYYNMVGRYKGLLNPLKQAVKQSNVVLKYKEV